MMMITTIFHPLVSEFEAIFFSLSLPQSYVNNFNNFAEDFGIRFSFNNNVNIFKKGGRRFNFISRGVFPNSFCSSLKK